MQIRIEGVPYQLPVSLMEITIADRIAFDNTYGKELAEKLKAISEIPEEFDRELSFIEYHCELALKTVSFFGKIPLEVLEQTKMDDVLLIYHQTMKALSADVDFKDESFQLSSEFAWNEELWEVAPPELKHDSAMHFGEFLDAKQWMKNLYEFGNDHWEALLMLCCVYFRKKGERYKPELSAEGGERYQLLQNLPLEYALHVGFFLSGSMSSYLRTFPSSNLPEELEVKS